MRKVDTGPLLKDNDKIHFLDSHRPFLKDGDFEVSVKHSVGSLEIEAERTFRFSVAGPRFALQPSDVASKFPPKGASGDFEAVLPHLILNRSTLPWERTSILEESVTPGQTTAGPTPSTAPSWLALLVFAEDEIAGASQIVKASDLVTAQIGERPAAPSGGDTLAMLTRTSTDDPQMPVLVLDLPAQLAEKILPQIGDLEYLTSARMVKKAAEEGNEVSQSADPERAKDKAVVMANRLPVPGKRNIVHLVSLEHQYRLIEGADRRHKWTKTHSHWSRILTPGDTIRLVSLAHWDFHCDKSKGDLQAILDDVAPSWLTLLEEGHTTSSKAVYNGAVPVKHHLSSGEKTAAWYRGPVHPVRKAQSHESFPFALPVRHARDLILIDEATGLADISYAAAWELGRLLALKDPSVGIRINQWKRQVAHADHARKDWQLAGEIGHEIHKPDYPKDLRDWFEHALGRLGAVPFDYIVPEPDLLPNKPPGPTEHIAWFTLDNAWISALYDGAFSVGRTSTRQLTADAVYYPLRIPNRSGILLRSKAVSGWPDLVVDGFDEQSGSILDNIRFDYIGNDTLLVLFEGLVGKVDVHLHPQALHFGFDRSASSNFTKNQGKPIKFRAKDERVIDLVNLAEDVLGAQSVHDFSTKMIEPAPRISFNFYIVVPRQ